MTGKVCEARGCSEEAVALGLCQAHCDERYGPPKPVLSKPRGRPKNLATPICGMEDCDKAVHARGVCRNHYSQLYRAEQVEKRALAPVVVVVPDDLIPLVEQLVAIDAANCIRQLIWPLIGESAIRGVPLDEYLEEKRETAC